MLKMCATFLALAAFSVTAVAETCYSDKNCATKIKRKSDIACGACLKTKGPGKSWKDGGDCIKKKGECP